MNRTAISLTMFALAGLCLAYGAYRLYGWAMVPIPLLLMAWASWETLKNK